MKAVILMAVGRNERQRELEKLYNKLCGRYSRYEVWQDMVVMIACSIANAAARLPNFQFGNPRSGPRGQTGFDKSEIWQSHLVDKRHFDEREAMYMRVVQKYTKDELAIFPEFFTHIVMGMEENPDCDFLGELYMNLELGNKYAGQFFTPYDICRAMAEVTIDDDFLKAQIEKYGWISVNDCACGAGATLVAAANHFRKIGINYQTQALFVAQDVDMTVALMCYIQLSLLGCAGYVVIGNTLTEPQTGNVLFGEESSRCWFTPMYFHEVWQTRRAIEQMKMTFRAVATASPEAAEAKPKASMADAEAPEKAVEAPESVPEPEAESAESPPQYQPTLSISTKKKNSGQIMFDFG